MTRHLPYTTELLQCFAKQDPTSLMAALTDTETADIARHLLPDLAAEVLALRAQLAETTTHTLPAPLLPVQASPGGHTPPPIVCLG